MFTFGFSSFVKFVLRLFSTSEIINKNRKKKINGTVRHQASFFACGYVYLHDETHYCASGHVVRKSLLPLRLGNVTKVH